MVSQISLQYCQLEWQDIFACYYANLLTQVRTKQEFYEEDSASKSPPISGSTKSLMMPTFLGSCVMCLRSQHANGHA